MQDVERVAQIQALAQPDGHAVRAWRRSPCASCCARSAWTGSAGTAAGGRDVGKQPAVRSPELQARRRAVDRPDSPPRAPRGGAGDRATRGSTAWSGPRAPSDGRDGPGRTAARSPGSGSPGPMVERAPQCWRNRAGPGHGLTVSPLREGQQHHPASVVRQVALGGFRGNVRAVLEHGLAGKIRIRERRLRRRGPRPGIARPAPPGSGRGSSAASATRASASTCCWAMVARSAEEIGRGIIEAGDHPGALVHRHSVSRAEASAFMKRARTSGFELGRGAQSCCFRPGGRAAFSRLACCRLVTCATVLRSYAAQPRTIRSAPGRAAVGGRTSLGSKQPGQGCQDHQPLRGTAGHENGGESTTAIDLGARRSRGGRTFPLWLTTPLSRLTRADSGTAECRTPPVGKEA